MMDASADLRDSCNAITTLKSAAKDGSVQQIKQLLIRGVDPDARDENGRTALHWASERGQEGAVRTLIDWMAQVDIQASDGQTPLHLASWHNQLAVVELLVKSGADANIRRSFGAAALHIAAENDGYEKVVLALLTAGANCNLPRDDGVTPTLLGSLHSSASLLRIMLSNANADPNLADIRGVTALHVIAFKGDSDAMNALIIAGADPKAIRLDNHESALHSAAFAGKEEVIDQLLGEGCDPRARNFSGQTAAVQACIFGHHAVLHQLGVRCPFTDQLPDGSSSVALKLDELLKQVSIKGESAKATDLIQVSQKKVDEEVLSNELHAALNSSGFVRGRARVQSALADITQRIVRPTMESGEFADHDAYVVGSFSEGWSCSLVRLDGLTDPDSDLDFTIIDRKQVFHFEGSCKCEGSQKVIIEDGHVRWPETASNPAQTWHGLDGRPSVDLAWAFRSCGYPGIEVLDQPPGEQQQISSSVLHDLRCVQANPEFPCHLVTAALPGMEGKQMRISTTFLERSLVRSFNDVQGQVFVLMKFIVKKVISARVKGLKTYHAKSVIFYLLWEVPTEDWQPSKLLHLTRLALSKLHGFLMNDSTNEHQLMKHFFIREAWLYLKRDVQSGKQKIADVISEVLKSLPDIVQQFMANLRPITTDGLFHFHPFLLLPVLKAKTVKINWEDIKYSDLCDVVRSALLRLSSDKCGPDELLTLLEGVSRIPDFAYSARQCLLALTYLKLGKAKEARQVLNTWRGHRATRGLHYPICRASKGLEDDAEIIWQQLLSCDSAWKFCIEHDSPLEMSFLPDSLKQHFPVSFIFVNWYYVNFEAILVGLDCELNSTTARTNAKTWFEEVLQADVPDIHDVLITMEFCDYPDLIVGLIHKNKSWIKNHREVGFKAKELLSLSPQFLSCCIERTADALVQSLLTAE